MNERALEILHRIKEIRREINEAHLIAVTKYSPVIDVHYAYEADQFDFGENRVSDLKEKADYFHDHHLDKVRWHFIGHLQSNKVKDLLKIPHLFAIHSVDSQKLLEEIINRMHLFTGDSLQIFLQVNTSNEAEKSGFESVDDYIELKETIRFFLDYLKSNPSSPLKFIGLMTIGTIRTEDVVSEAHRCFKEMETLSQALKLEFDLPELSLSMGMSSDYKIALTYGSHYIRVGSSIFK